MATWTAPLPAAVNLSATAPGGAQWAALPPASPSVVIGVVPTLEPAAVAAFNGVGAYAAPYAPRAVYVVNLTGIGYLASFATRWTETLTASPAGTGTLSVLAKVGSGSVLSGAAFSGLGALLRTDAPFGGGGSATAVIVPVAPLLAAWSGTGALSATQTLGALLSGSGALSVIETPAAVTPAPPSGVGTLSATVVVNGAVVAAAGFSGLGGGTDPATGSAAETGTFAGLGVLSGALGAFGLFTGTGTLAAQPGAIAGYGSVGTLSDVVSFAAAFSGVSAAVFVVLPQAQFNGAGALAVAVTPSTALSGALSGAGTLSVAAGALDAAAFSGAGTLFESIWVPLAAAGSGTGTAAVAVSWSEAEAGAFTGVGTLSMAVAGSAGPAYALVYESPLYKGFGVSNEAYGLWYAPVPPDDSAM